MRFHNLVGLLMSMGLGMSTAHADGLTPQDAMSEAKIGVSGRFVQIKAGTFVMGSSADDPDHHTDETQHSVTLTNDFEMQATHVTQLQYFLVMGSNPSEFRLESNCDQGNFEVSYGLGMCKNHPVENVSWNDMQAMIATLNQMQSDYTYRLPTEAEWEYAALGGMPSGFPYWFGCNDTNLLDQYAWYFNNSYSLSPPSNSRTHEVATKKPNPYGLYDMNGNVWQWVGDWYAEDYPNFSVTDPAGPSSGRYRVYRGGSWANMEVGLRLANRTYGFPDFRRYTLGARLVRTRR